MLLKWKLAHTIPEFERQEWDKLCSLTLGPEVHPGRKNGFILARVALRECLKSQKIHLPISALVLENFDQIQGLTDWTISLAHTSSVGAAVVADRKEILSVGVDIESKSRLIRPEVLSRITHPEGEKHLALTLWCAKEAIFKCCMNTRTFEKNFEFSSIKVGSKDWEMQHLKGEWKTIEDANFEITLAWLKA